MLCFLAPLVIIEDDKIVKSQNRGPKVALFDI